MPLPSSYQRLYTSFTALDTAAGLFRSRNQPCYFSLLQPQVQRATGRDFSPALLRGILGVWPGAWRVARSGRQRGGALVHEWLLLPSTGCGDGDAECTPHAAEPRPTGVREAHAAGGHQDRRHRERRVPERGGAEALEIAVVVP